MSKKCYHIIALIPHKFWFYRNQRALGNRIGDVQDGVHKVWFLDMLRKDSLGVSWLV